MKLYIILFLLVFSSCNEDNQNKPSDFIDAQKMSRIYGDVLLMESYYQSSYGVPGNYKKALDASLSKVYKKHHVTKTQFEENYTYYASHPELFKAMNTAVMDRFSRELP